MKVKRYRFIKRTHLNVTRSEAEIVGEEKQQKARDG